MDHRVPVDTAPARDAMLRNAADRAVDDPVKLARAARIVRAALARRKLTLADLTPASTADVGGPRV